MNYLDTSALVKRFVAEKGSEIVIALAESGEPIGTAKIAYAEVFGPGEKAPLSGAVGSELPVRSRAIRKRLPLYLRIDLLDEVLSLARELIERHPLRGSDAIHLASAVTLGGALEEEVTFVAADTCLLQAAKGEGLQTLNPEG